MLFKQKNELRIGRVTALSMLGAALAGIAVADDRMNEPYGSRYLNYSQNAVWSSHYGTNSDQGWPTSLYQKAIADVNGDGRADAVAFGKPGTFVSLSNGTSFSGSTMAIANFGTDQAWTVENDPRFVADINGDGKGDLLGYGIQGVWAATYSGNNTTPAFSGFKLWSNQFGSSQNSGFYLNSDFIRTVADMNNDGKSDLVVFADTGVQVALSNGNGFDGPTLWIGNFGTNASWNNTNTVRELADVNGDGLLDVVGYGWPAVFVALNNNGTGFHSAERWTTQFSKDDRSGFFLNSDFIRTTGDADGDGKADLIVFSDTGIQVAKSTGSAFSSSSQWVAAFGTASGFNNTKYKRVVADVNGDSKVDIVGFGDAGTFFSMSQGVQFSPAQKWVSDFGYQQAWRNTTDPRFLRDVNGDGVLDLTGYGLYGVYVSASAPLYCCDETYFYDPQFSRYVVEGQMARVFLPAIYNKITMPKKDTSVCTLSNYPDIYHPVGQNTNAGQPWLNESWRVKLNARFAVNANFFDIHQDPRTSECSVGLGLAISEGDLLSPYSQFNGEDTTALLVYTPTHATRVGKNAEMVLGTQVTNWQGNVQFAISGMRLITNGVAVASEPVPTSARARAAVGLTRDNKTLLFIVQNNGHDGGSPANESASLPAMANALLKMGAYNAINLDGSGSAQLWFKNNKIEFKSEPSDGSGQYRGIPVPFGIE
ncbi:phosphodiester glycosidase family protein [Hoeflea sp.]|uniref:phosphodiester glycosidase family protein n=1 Tax=Hoeflea sp. TaxID=1940281 RepID=UPI0037489AD6